MKKLLVGVFGVAVFATASASAESYYWTGAVNDVWDKVTLNWAQLSDGKACTWPRPSETILDTARMDSSVPLSLWATNSLTIQIKSLLVNVEENKELTVKIDYANGFWGVPENQAAIRKTGAGQWTVSSANRYPLFVVSGSIVNVEEGTFKVDDPGDSSSTAYNNALAYSGKRPGTLSSTDTFLDATTGRVLPAKITEFNVFSGATMWIAASHMTGNRNYGSGIRLRLQDGATLKVAPDAKYANLCGATVDQLLLEGGNVVFDGTSSVNYGMLGAGSLLKLSGTKACTLSAGDDATRAFILGYGGDVKGNLFQDHACPVIDVADVTGNSEVDLDINMPIGHNEAPGGNMVSFEKKGAGTLRFSYDGKTDSYGVSGNVKIWEGEVLFYGVNSLHQHRGNTILVSTNATLTMATRAVTGAGAVQDGGKSSATFHLDHGRMVLDPSIANYKGLGYNGYTYLGKSLILENAQVESYVRSYSEDKDTGLQAMIAGELIHAKAVAGESWSADFTARDPSIPHQKLQLNAPCTEFRIEDTTGSDEVDMTLGYKLVNFCPNDGTKQSSCLVKTGAGTLMITNKLNLVDSVEVHEGTLLVKNPAAGSSYGQYSLSEGTAATYLGNVSAEDGVVLVTTNGTLKFDRLCEFSTGSYGDGAKHLAVTKRPLVINGGKVDISGNSGNGNSSFQTFGSVTIKNGGVLDYSNSKNQLGAFGVHGKLTISGTLPVDLPAASAGAHGRIFLWPNYQTTFEVEEVTGDLATDFTLGLCPGMPGDQNYFNGTTELQGQGQPGDTWWYGWTKTGAGTMELKYCDAARFHTLPAIVSNGTLIVSANFNRSVTLNSKTHTCAGFEVRSGAYIGGTGTVASVTLEAGAGLFVAEDQAAPLTSQAAVTIPASGTVVIRATPGQSGFALRNVCVLASPNGFVDADNLSNWTISVPGYTNPNVSLVRKGNTLCATTKRGMIMFVK